MHNKISNKIKMSTKYKPTYTNIKTQKAENKTIKKRN